MKLLNRTLTIEQIIGLIENAATDPSFTTCNEQNCLITQGAMELAEEVRRLSKHKWLLLGANNVDSNITVASFETKEDAQKEMQSQIDALTEESNNAECSIEETAASVYIQSNYWYWNIVPIESES